MNGQTDSEISQLFSDRVRKSGFDNDGRCGDFTIESKLEPVWVHCVGEVVYDRLDLRYSPVLYQLQITALVVYPGDLCTVCVATA